MNDREDYTDDFAFIEDGVEFEERPYCSKAIEQYEIYYIFDGRNVCERCLSDHLIHYSQVADYRR